MSRTSRTFTVTGPRETPNQHANRVATGVMIVSMIGIGAGTAIYQHSIGTDWMGSIVLGVFASIFGAIPGAILGMIAYPFAWTYFRLFGDVQIRAEQFTEDEPAARPASQFLVVRRYERD